MGKRTHPLLRRGKERGRVGGTEKEETSNGHIEAESQRAAVGQSPADVMPDNERKE